MIEKIEIFNTYNIYLNKKMTEVSETDIQTYGNFGLHWPPTDEDFMNVMKSAIKKNKDWDSVLIFVKNMPDLLQYNPVAFGHCERFQQTFKIEDNDKQYTVILAEID
tara:strand:+ start:28 stop:348 length:321 start_codon:yes stop_codon:yes gene_type:complete